MIPATSTSRSNLGLLGCAVMFLVAFAATVVASSAAAAPAETAKAVGAPAAAAQQPKQGKQPKAADTRVFYGVASCRSCHLKGFEDPDTFICRGTEVAIWQPEDKHALAYKVLSDDRAQRMGKILGWDVKTRRECLACHSVLVDEKPGVIEKSTNLNLADGVSCVACHGPDIVGLPVKDQLPKLGWLDMHGSQNQRFREAWRNLPRSFKQDEYGMADLWDPVKRTQLCAACHIGNVEQGKVVTHEMYAAGHPPLPGFEVATFSNQMPRHWQYLGEKNKKVRDLVMKFRPTEVELEETHLLAIGGLVSFREYLQLLASQASTKEWPEFAHYSCYACHHDLKPKSWRQEGGYAGKPGRPPLREWTTALVDLGLFHAAGSADEAKKLSADFHTHMAAFQQVFDVTPFGQPATVKQEAEKFIGWIDTQVKRIQDRIALDEKKGGYGSDASGQLLAHLMEMHRAHPDKAAKAKRPMLDFDSARQLSWAYQTLYLETMSKHDPAARKKLQESLKTHAGWKDLDDYLRLTLPPGQTKIEPSLGTALERIGSYEPRQYFKHFEDLLSPAKGKGK